MKVEADITTYFIEESGNLYVNGDKKPLSEVLDIMSIDTLRLAIFSEESSLLSIEESIQKVKQLNKKLYLAIHCSDTWADPSHQLIPNSWSFANIKELRICFVKYLTSIFELVQSNQIDVKYIQVGNEISNGMLWPYLANPYEYLEFIKTAHGLCRKYFPQALIVLHTDLSYSTEKACRWYSLMKKCRVDYDLVGLSYYPVWHGHLERLSQTITDVVKVADKKVMLCEVGYMNTEEKTTAWFGDWRCGDIEYSAQGQMQYMRHFKEFLNQRNNEIYPEIFYWGAFSHLSNEHYPIALFSRDGIALPAFYEFNHI